MGSSEYKHNRDQWDGAPADANERWLLFIEEGKRLSEDFCRITPQSQSRRLYKLDSVAELPTGDEYRFFSVYSKVSLVTGVSKKTGVIYFFKNLSVEGAIPKGCCDLEVELCFASDIKIGTSLVHGPVKMISYGHRTYADRKWAGTKYQAFPLDGSEPFDDFPVTVKEVEEAIGFVSDLVLAAKELDWVELPKGSALLNPDGPVERIALMIEGPSAEGIDSSRSR
ncbi:MAG: hypothetical protein AAF591_14440 [Verrucomicrobiota bacterium]